MEETRDTSRETTVLVVDKGIKDLCFCREGNDVVVSDFRWNETGVSFREGDLVSRCTDFDGAFPPYAHRDDETVVLDEVSVHGL